MHRECTTCRRPFTPADFVRDESKNMEAERKAAGLTGIRFMYYGCPACATGDIFVDILPLDGETPESFRQRRDEMQTVVRGLHAEQPAGKVDAVVTEVHPLIRWPQDVTPDLFAGS